LINKDAVTVKCLADAPFTLLYYYIFIWVQFFSIVKYCEKDVINREKPIIIILLMRE